MLKRVGAILIPVIILGALAVFLLPALSMTYVPTPAQVNQHTVVTPFQVQPSGTEGVYGNYDIDALVFRYTTGVADTTTFTTTLDQQAIAAGWTRLPDKAGSTCYERITPKGNRTFCGAEQVRVQFDPESKRVNVGWVQGDAFEDVASFSETHESDWAESEVWPKLNGP